MTFQLIVSKTPLRGVHQSTVEPATSQSIVQHAKLLHYQVSSQLPVSK